MVAWSLFAVGGVYVWAGVPLMIAALALAAVGRPRPGASRDTRTIDRTLVAAVAATALQLVPLPATLRAVLSPHADAVRSALVLGETGASRWRPLSIDPSATIYSLGLLIAALIVFWTARRAFAHGMTRRVVTVVAISGLIASFVAIVLHATADRTLIYGRWPAVDVGARPYGPFVNRNHFATWLVMAIPLSVGFVGAWLAERRAIAGVAAKAAAMFEALGSRAGWVTVSCAVMALALVTSTSRSGLIALTSAAFVAAWVVRERAGRRTLVLGAITVVAMGIIGSLYVNMQPLLSRVDETIDVGAGGRPRIWKETLGVARDFWPAGTGLGTYRDAMLVYQEDKRGGFFNQAHNQYLHLLSDGGLLLAVPALLATVAFIALLRVRLAGDKSPTQWLRIGAATAVLAVAIQGIWETGLRMPANGVLFAIAAAAAVHRSKADV